MLSFRLKKQTSKNAVDTFKSDWVLNTPLSNTNVCHLILTCSRFPILHGEARQQELATWIWKCHLHISMVVNTPVSQHEQQQLQQQAAPQPPPSLRSLVSQGLSLAEAKNIKENCGKCSVTLWSNTVHVSCYHCNKGHHQKCSTGPKGLPCDIDWNCNKCAKILQQSSSANIPQPPAPNNTTPSQKLPGLGKLHARWWEFMQHAR